MARDTMAAQAIPAHKVIPGTGGTIVVDAFRYAHPGVRAYFLTHAHCDHYTGLTENWCSGPIYCSEITARLVAHLCGVDPVHLQPLPMGQPVTVAGVEVTLVDANHCPGAVQLLFRLSGSAARYLHCGDMRFCSAMTSCPLLAAWRGCEAVFLDTTYCQPKHTFPLQEESVEYVVQTLRALLEEDRAAETAVAATGSHSGAGGNQAALALSGASTPEKNQVVGQPRTPDPDPGYVPGLIILDQHRAADQGGSGSGALHGLAVNAVVSSSGAAGALVDHNSDGGAKAVAGKDGSAGGVVMAADTSTEAEAGGGGAGEVAAAVGCGGRGGAFRRLYLISTYVIGKERILLAIRQRCGVRVHVPETKLAVLRLIGLPGQQIDDTFTTDPRVTPVHVVSWGTLGETWPFFRPNFVNMQRIAEEMGAPIVVGFCPTGWLYEMKRAAFPVRTRGSLSVHLVPYSEHSSYSELREYVRWLRPQQIIPTVGVGGDDGERNRAAMLKHFRLLVDETASKARFLAGMRGRAAAAGSTALPRPSSVRHPYDDGGIATAATAATTTIVELAAASRCPPAGGQDIAPAAATINAAAAAAAVSVSEPIGCVEKMSRTAELCSRSKSLSAVEGSKSLGKAGRGSGRAQQQARGAQPRTRSRGEAREVQQQGAGRGRGRGGGGGGTTGAAVDVVARVRDVEVVGVHDVILIDSSSSDSESGVGSDGDGSDGREDEGVGKPVGCSNGSSANGEQEAPESALQSVLSVRQQLSQAEDGEIGIAGCATGCSVKCGVESDEPKVKREVESSVPGGSSAEYGGEDLQRCAGCCSKQQQQLEKQQQLHKARTAQQLPVPEHVAAGGASDVSYSGTVAVDSGCQHSQQCADSPPGSSQPLKLPPAPPLPSTLEQLMAVLGSAVSIKDTERLLAASRNDVMAAANIYFDGGLASLPAAGSFGRAGTCGTKPPAVSRLAATVSVGTTRAGKMGTASRPGKRARWASPGAVGSGANRGQQGSQRSIAAFFTQRNSGDVAKTAFAAAAPLGGGNENVDSSSAVPASVAPVAEVMNLALSMSPPRAAGAVYRQPGKTPIGRAPLAAATTLAGFATMSSFPPKPTMATDPPKAAAGPLTQGREDYIYKQGEAAAQGATLHIDPGGSAVLTASIQSGRVGRPQEVPGMDPSNSWAVRPLLSVRHRRQAAAAAAAAATATGPAAADAPAEAMVTYFVPSMHGRDGGGANSTAPQLSDGGDDLNLTDRRGSGSGEPMDAGAGWGGPSSATCPPRKRPRVLLDLSKHTSAGTTPTPYRIAADAGGGRSSAGGGGVLAVPPPGPGATEGFTPSAAAAAAVGGPSASLSTEACVQMPDGVHVKQKHEFEKEPPLPECRTTALSVVHAVQNPFFLSGGAKTTDPGSAPKLDQLCKAVLLPPAKYDPVRHACWGPSPAPTPYLHVALSLAAIDSTTKRLEIADALTNMFRSVLAVAAAPAEDLVAVLYMVTGRIAPEYEKMELSVGGATVSAALMAATGTNADRLKQLYRQFGDLGDVAQVCRRTQSTLRSPQRLLVGKVLQQLRTIAADKGTGVAGRRQAALLNMLRACRGCEVKYLTRTLISNLRVGANWRSVLGPLGRAVLMHQRRGPAAEEATTATSVCGPRAGGGGGGGASLPGKAELDAAAAAVVEAYHLCPNFEVLVPALVEDGVGGLRTRCVLSPGVPIKPMLAKICEGVEDGLRQLGPGVPFLAEYKYDGVRAQIHLLPDGRVFVFSRNSEDRTASYPDVCDLIRSAAAALPRDSSQHQHQLSRQPHAADVNPATTTTTNTSSCMLDAEVVAVEWLGQQRQQEGEEACEGIQQILEVAEVSTAVEEGEEGKDRAAITAFADGRVGSGWGRRVSVGVAATDPKGDTPAAPYRLRAFQELATRARGQVQQHQVTVQVCVFVFDLLFWNGQSLLNRPLRERRTLLPAALPGMSPGRVMLATATELEPLLPYKPVEKTSPGALSAAGRAGEALAAAAAAAGLVRRWPAPGERGARRLDDVAAAAAAPAAAAAVAQPSVPLARCFGRGAGTASMQSGAPSAAVTLPGVVTADFVDLAQEDGDEGGGGSADEVEERRSSDQDHDHDHDDDQSAPKPNQHHQDRQQRGQQQCQHGPGVALEVQPYAVSRGEVEQEREGDQRLGEENEVLPASTLLTICASGEAADGSPAPDQAGLDRAEAAHIEGLKVAARTRTTAGPATMTTSARDAVYDMLLQALHAGVEGLMLKRLDGSAAYQPSRRSESWIKVKRDYVEGLRDSVDVVPIGAWYGQGRKVKWFSPILLAVYEPVREEFQSLCRCMSGFSDEFYIAARERLGATIIPGPKPYYNTREQPSVWFQPTEVWELRGADLTISPVHRAAVGHLHPERGVGLRFPRFIRIREDKRPEDATTSDYISDLYSRQTRKVAPASQKPIAAEGPGGDGQSNRAGRGTFGPVTLPQQLSAQGRLQEVPGGHEGGDGNVRFRGEEEGYGTEGGEESDENDEGSWEGEGLEAEGV